MSAQMKGFVTFSVKLNIFSPLVLIINSRFSPFFSVSNIRAISISKFYMNLTKQRSIVCNCCAKGKYSSTMAPKSHCIPEQSMPPYILCKPTERWNICLYVCSTDDLTVSQFTADLKQQKLILKR